MPDMGDRPTLADQAVTSILLLCIVLSHSLLAAGFKTQILCMAGANVHLDQQSMQVNLAAILMKWANCKLLVEQVFEVVSELVVCSSGDIGVSQAEQNRQRLGQQLEGLLHKVSAPHVLCCMFGLLLQVINHRFIFLMIPSQRSAWHVSSNFTHLRAAAYTDIFTALCTLYFAWSPKAIPIACKYHPFAVKQG